MQDGLNNLWTLFGFSLIVPFMAWTVFAFICRGSLKWNLAMLKSAGTNVGLFVFNGALAPFVFVALIYLDGAYRDLGVPVLSSDTWAGMPIIVAALFSLFLVDFINYWHHRLMHSSVWYWPIHAPHHTDTQINFTTLFRVHAFEAIAMQVTFILFASWLGVPPLAAFIASVANTVLGQYGHLDLPISHGKIGDKIITSPQVHHWHHADIPQAYGKNLANFFSFLDVIFGTYYNPGPCNVPLGMKDGPDQNLLGNILLPFTEWRKLLNKRRDGDASQPVTQVV